MHLNGWDEKQISAFVRQICGYSPFKKLACKQVASHRADLCRTMESMRLEIKAKELLCSIAPTLYNMVKGKLDGQEICPET